MNDLFGVGFDIPYAKRLDKLTEFDVALWDVLSSCFRPGSLDANITAAQPNDFAGLFARQPTIRRVFFNGGKAADVFRRKVLPDLGGAELVYQTLPSTSPAHASRTYAQKLQAWMAVRDAQCSG